jgi:hypothetical protein
MSDVDRIGHGRCDGPLHRRKVCCLTRLEPRQAAILGRIRQGAPTSRVRLDLARRPPPPIPALKVNRRLTQRRHHMLRSIDFSRPPSQLRTASDLELEPSDLFHLVTVLFQPLGVGPEPGCCHGFELLASSASPVLVRYRPVEITTSLVPFPAVPVASQSLQTFLVDAPHDPRLTLLRSGHV